MTTILLPSSRDFFCILSVWAAEAGKIGIESSVLTLVTDGVMLMDCYVYVSLNSDVSSFIFYVGFLAIVFSGFCVLAEEDAKKIVALIAVNIQRLKML
uniref:NADH:ubiquinone reductase (H(+)-translocating) n=1 Tax=Onchocerca volvulus TaxID=6282 RepID=A0A8R1TYX5_ONCVO